ncbi:uncharacterized protein LOC123201604 [Mangifera indica]|uniref:uncharacterized protein LOC123201604 n=1 Tax=Mangifera indica TaxID=29780 RepID=UPI001CFA0D88|nr:uncharacterized protein LOC123201604 [Mangifera indica]
MSESDKEISRVGGTVDDYDDDDDDQTIGVGGGGDDDGAVLGNDGEEKHGGFGCTQIFRRRIKKVVLFPVSQAKKQLYNRRQRQQNRRVSFSDASANAGEKFGGTSSKVCSFCFMQPQTLDTSDESITSDPNDPKFSNEMLRSLIENNDFYSKECNPHLNFHG